MRKCHFMFYGHISRMRNTKILNLIMDMYYGERPGSGHAVEKDLARASEAMAQERNVLPQFRAWMSEVWDLLEKARKRTILSGL